MKTQQILVYLLLYFLSTSVFADDAHDHHHHGEIPMSQVSPSPLDKSAHNMRVFDHPLARGSLNDKEAEPIMREFAAQYQLAKKDRKRSTIEVFDAFIEKLGTRRLTAYFENKNTSCHGVLHNMGKVVAKHEANLINAIGICSDACTYACVHGVMKTHFSDQVDGGKKTTQDVQQELVDICHKPPIIPDFFEGNCAHAAGHAFGIIADQRLSSALGLCTVFENKEMHFYCEGGVYMQLMGILNRALYTSKKASRQSKVDLRMRFCFHAGTSVSACMRFVLSKYYRRADLTRIRNKHCKHMQGSARRGCFNGLGYLARAKVIAKTLDIKALCQGDDKEDLRQCISGFAFVKKNHGEAAAMDAACHALKEPELTQFCLNQHNNKHLYQTGNALIEAMY